MSPTNSREVESEQPHAECALAAIQTYQPQPDERNHRRSHPVSRIPYLDVDAVLARSLPKVTGARPFGEEG